MSLISVFKEYLSDIPFRALRPWLAVALLMTVLQALPADMRDMLRFDRGALEAGEVMRLVTANFIHLGWSHLLLNMAGFLVIGWLFADEVPAVTWFVVLLVSCMASSLGMYWLTPDAYWVVGLSGALHGLFVFGAVSWIVHGFRTGWGLLLGVAGKLIWEQISGAIPLTEGVVGGPVVTDAHLWGAIGGLCAGLAYGVWHRYRSRL
jgi:rhomboid family GlyGly-CTERM serine protease